MTSKEKDEFIKQLSEECDELLQNWLEERDQHNKLKLYVEDLRKELYDSRH